MQGLDKSIHCLIVRMDFLPFVKPLKVFLTERFVLMK